MKKIIICLLAVFLITACGKKPGSVLPPPDLEQDEFPATYPKY